MSARVVDRYALVSSADPLDRAWISLGWSPALEGERASALRDSVPWPSVTAGQAEPAWLRGAVGDVLAPANWDRLDFAFLPLDGRLSLSVWGAVGPRIEATREWRVLTHTLLFDRDVFDAVAGNPFALLRSAGAPAPWLRELAEELPLDAPGPLAPVPVARGRDAEQAYRAEHLRELAALRGRVLAAHGGDTRALEAALARTYEALARAVGAGRTATLAEGDGVTPRLLARLAWLSLPLADRAEVSFTTQQRRTRAPLATLAVLPASEWGRLAPDGALPADDVDPPAAGGRRFWAHAVAHHGDGPPADALDYAGVLRRAQTRHWRIVARDDLGPVEEQKAWADRWRRGAGDRPALAAELLELERRRGPRAGGPRWRAVGHVLALAERAAPDGHAGTPPSPDAAVAAARALVARLRPLAPEQAAGVTAGLVRTLARGGPGGRRIAALVRCLAASGESPATPREALGRLLGREAPLLDDLLRDPFGPAVLFRAAAELARTGDAEVRPLLERALAGMEDTDSAVDWLQRTLRLADPRDASLARHILALGEELHPERFPDPARLGGWMLAGLEAAPADGHAARALASWLVRPAVLAWYVEDAAEEELRRWLAATAVPVDALTAHQADRPDAGRLPRVIAVAVELGHGAAAARLLGEGLRRHPGASWAALVESVPAGWLRERATLTALEAAPAVGAAAVRRIAAELGGDTLADAEVEGVLRLLWLEARAAGEPGTIRWIEAELPRHRAVPVLAQLFVGPTPLEVASALRAALLRLVADAHGRVETGVPAAALRQRAPAVADALDGVRPRRTPLVFLAA